MSDSVNHSSHYTSHPSGVECITVAEHMSFNVGNAMKYLWRADLKGDAIEDLRKAAWYVNREIERRTKAHSMSTGGGMIGRMTLQEAVDKVIAGDRESAGSPPQPVVIESDPDSPMEIVNRIVDTGCLPDGTRVQDATWVNRLDERGLAAFRLGETMMNVQVYDLRNPAFSVRRFVQGAAEQSLIAQAIEKLLYESLNRRTVKTPPYEGKIPRSTIRAAVKKVVQSRRARESADSPPQPVVIESDPDPDHPMTVEQVMMKIISSWRWPGGPELEDVSWDPTEPGGPPPESLRFNMDGQQYRLAVIRSDTEPFLVEENTDGALFRTPRCWEIEEALVSLLHPRPGSETP